MLSGHPHNGRLWPFGYLVRLSYPLLGARYEVGGMPVIACRGTSTSGPPMRPWQRSEIAVRAPPAELIHKRWEESDGDQDENRAYERATRRLVAFNKESRHA
jgi:hypothetical protein